MPLSSNGFAPPIAQAPLCDDGRGRITKPTFSVWGEGATTGRLVAPDILDAWLTTEYDGGRHDISLGLIAEAEAYLSENSAWAPSERFFGDSAR